MCKETTFIVINAENLRSLEAIVTLKLREGWELAGSIYSQPREEPINSLIWSINNKGTGLTNDNETVKSVTNWCQPMLWRPSDLQRLVTAIEG